MLKQWTITIPQLTGEETRNAYVYVPDWYDGSQRFPVLYMFDGQNLFHDEDASYGKSWGILDYLENTGLGLIVAAVECNHHSEQDACGGRLSEYSPFDFKDPWWGSITGRGKITMDWLVNEFKPYIDERYPTLPQREYTFISGSSMGGLMTIYALMEYNEYFSRGAALSPAIGFSQRQVAEMIRNADIGRTVLYVDFGEHEVRSLRRRNMFSALNRTLTAKGVLLETRIVPEGRHNEETWEKQVPFFMEVLFYDL